MPPAAQVVGLALLTLTGLSRAAGQTATPCGQTLRVSAPHAVQIARVMGGVSWGMSKDAVQKRLVADVWGAYRDRLVATHDVGESRRLRRAIDAELLRIAESYVVLGGVANQWEDSFLRDELTRDARESLLMRRDQTARTFYFFRDGKLWKIYKVFEALVLPEGNFAGFVAALQQNFGPGESRQSERRSFDQRRWMEWNEGRTKVRAIDETHRHGFYSLSFEDSKNQQHC